MKDTFERIRDLADIGTVLPTHANMRRIQYLATEALPRESDHVYDSENHVCPRCRIERQQRERES